MPDAAKSYTLELLSEKNVKKYVLPYYDMENADISQIKLKDTDKQRAVYKIDHDGRSYCLKKVYFSLEELLFVYSAIEWYYKNGINVPRILPTSDRNRFVNYKDMYFILTPWVDGIKCDYDSIDNIMDAVDNMARMHLCAQNFAPIKGSCVRKFQDNPYESYTKHLKQMLDCSNLAFRYKDKFSRAFLQNFDLNLLLAQTAVNIASTINTDNLSTSLCHLDYVNKNLIFDEQGKIWVIDFDKCKIDLCVHDIGYFLRRILKRNNTKWDLEIAVNSLNTYDKIRPLSLDEYKYILVYLCFPQKFWKISRDYYNNIKKCNQNAFLTLLKKTVEKDQQQLDFVLKFGRYIEKKFDTKLK